MKSLAILAVAAVALIGGLFTNASAQRPALAHPSYRMVTMLAPRALHPLSGITVQRVPVLMADGTAQPTTTSTPLPTTTSTPQPTDTPTPTPTTGPSYPDALTVLQSMFSVLALVKSVHFIDAAVQSGDVALKIKVTGDATCNPSAFMASVVATSSVTGTSQVSKKTFKVIQVKSSIFIKDKKTRNKWEPAKLKDITVFGFPASNPLCSPSSGSSGSGSGTGGPQAKDVYNAGPTTFAGQSVWDIKLTLVFLDSNGNEVDVPVEYFVGQSHPLLYGYKQTFTDTTSNVTDVETLTFSKYGEKIKIKKPKPGSTQP